MTEPKQTVPFCEQARAVVRDDLLWYCAKTGKPCIDCEEKR